MSKDWSNETFGSLISFHRKHIRGGMPQNSLAEKVGVSPQYINDIENDRRVPSDDVITKLASELHLPDDYLYWMAGKMPPDLRASEKDPIFVTAGLAMLREWFDGAEGAQRVQLGARSISDAQERLSRSLRDLSRYANAARSQIEQWSEEEGK